MKLKDMFDATYTELLKLEQIKTKKIVRQTRSAAAAVTAAAIATATAAAGEASKKDPGDDPGDHTGEDPVEYRGEDPGILKLFAQLRL